MSTEAESPPTIVALLLQRRSDLPRGERRVAQALVSTYPLAGLQTLAQLAARAGVSGPTVLRLLARLGFAGYSDFQRALQEEVHERLATVGSFYDTDRVPDESDVIATLLHRTRHNLAATIANADAAELGKVVEVLADTRGRVVCLGGVFEQALALHLHVHLAMLRPDTVFVPAGSSLLWNEIAGLKRHDVVVAFDFRRYDASTLAACRAATARGARVVLFTDPWFSPIVVMAAHALICHTESPSPFDSYTAGFAMVETIAAGLAMHLGSAAQTRIQAVEELAGGVAPNNHGGSAAGR
jgi:DNA-binding MurR/RpiR family transcriptional regulator